MDDKSKIADVDIPVLPGSFDISSKLKDVDDKAKEIRFFGKLLGERDGKILCENNAGIYEFDRKDVIRIRPLHKRVDMFLININAQYVLHSSLARLMRNQREIEEIPELSEPNKEPKERKITDLLYCPGNREWRGISEDTLLKE